MAVVERERAAQEQAGGGYQQGFATQREELTIAALPVQGEVPRWLQGMLLRNGPAMFEVGAETYRHWFDGLAMLHRFGFQDGVVSYANKFLHSADYHAAIDDGKITYSAFATDPCRSIFKRMATMFSNDTTQNANVNIGVLAGRFVAWTELPIPMEFDPETLATIGRVKFDDKVSGIHNTPHPHLERGTNAGINNITRFGGTSSYQVYRIADGTATRQLIASVAAKEPAYMHSFGLTDNYVVLAEYPYVVNPLSLIFSGKPFIENFVWKPERGTTFIVVDKLDGKMVRRYKAEPFFCFHHVNAFEQDDELIVDLLGYDDPAIIAQLYLAPLRRENTTFTPVYPGQLRRYHINLGSGAVSYELLCDDLMELPRINYSAYNARPYRYIYANGLHPDHDRDFLNDLLKVDIESGSVRRWYEPNCYPGEPVFVAAPDAQGEDVGVILSVVLDAAKSTSFLLVLDASSFSELARAEVPIRIPFGFHGNFYR